MRIALAVLMVLHAVAHLPGFLTSWRLAVLQGMPYRTMLFGGRVDVGDSGMRVVGVLWLLVAAGFLVTAFGAVFGERWWMLTAAAVAVGSLTLCIAESPFARIGVVVNGALLVFVVLAALGRGPGGSPIP